MRLAGGDVGDEEGNVGELAAADRRLLLQVHVVAHCLVPPKKSLALAVGLDHPAVLAHLEGEMKHIQVSYLSLADVSAMVYVP